MIYKILYELYRMFNMSLQPKTRRMVWTGTRSLLWLWIVGYFI